MDDWSGGSRCFSAPGTRASYCFRWIPYARDAQRCEFAVGLRDKHWSGWLWALAGRSPPERKPVQPATARPHTPRYRQNPRNLALGWCLIRSFWLNQLTLCWRGLDSNFQYARELAPGRRRKKAGCDQGKALDFTRCDRGHLGRDHPAHRTFEPCDRCRYGLR